MAAAADEGDTVEIRLDALREIRLDAILPFDRCPLIVTNRKIDEGGLFQGEEALRFTYLSEAVRRGVAYVDAEWSAPPSLLSELMAARGNTEIILSHHILDHTPPLDELLRIFREMTEMKPDIVKIVTLAKTPDDTLTVFRLLNHAGNFPTPVIAHCMGAPGKVSRALAPLFGSFLTYASPAGGKPSAPGQMSATALRQIWKTLGCQESGPIGTGC